MEVDLRYIEICFVASSRTNLNSNGTCVLSKWAAAAA